MKLTVEKYYSFIEEYRKEEVDVIDENIKANITMLEV